MLAIRVVFMTVVLSATSTQLSAQQLLVPGTGQKITKVGDDFEDAKWSYQFNPPKSSEENDNQQRVPGGQAANGRWYEGIKRGHPDVIQRVTTPPDGLSGSEGSLMFRSLHTGVPGRFGRQNSQDDLIVNMSSRLGGGVTVNWSPNVVVRVFLPPWSDWEQRTGNSFGFRAACQAWTQDTKSRRGGMKWETYWPGMFIHFNKGDGKKTQDSATLILRAGQVGNDFWGPKITETGWWTLGMSFPPNGQVQYYAHAGIEDLTAKDHLSTQTPYGFRCDHVDTFFFNVVNGDNGNWSTSWIIDDPTLYYTKR